MINWFKQSDEDISPDKALEIKDAYNKIIFVIQSCKTEDQIDKAAQMISLFHWKYKNKLLRTWLEIELSKN